MFELTKVSFKEIKKLIAPSTEDLAKDKNSQGHFAEVLQQTKKFNDTEGESNYHWFIGTDNNDIVTTACVGAKPDKDGPTHLFSIATNDLHKRQGYAKKTIDAIQKYYKNDLRLKPDETNKDEDLHGFYKHLGFVDEPSDKPYMTRKN